jgi:hypothetical protein
LRVTEATDLQFELVHDPWLRLQRALRLMPHRSLGTVRRSVLLVAIAWLPIVVWAIATGHLSIGALGDSATRHMGMHVRCLVAIPLLVCSEPVASRVIGTIVATFATAGLVPPEERPNLVRVLRSIERLRDSKLVWTLIAALVVLSAMVAGRRIAADDPDAFAWGANGGVLDFGAAWAVFVVRPMVVFLLLVWLWRLALTWLLFRRIAKLDLQLIASHPDRVGGLGFVELYTIGFSLVVLAISSVVCAAVGHVMLVHGGRLMEFKGQLILMIVLLVVLFLLPSTAFSGRLRRTFVRGQFEYGALASRFVRGVHGKWVQGKEVEDDILSASEIGPAVDLGSLYDMGTKLQMVPIGRLQVLVLLLPALLPVLAVATIEIPLKEIVLKLFEKLS